MNSIVLYVKGEEVFVLEGLSQLSVLIAVHVEKEIVKIGEKKYLGNASMVLLTI